MSRSDAVWNEQGTTPDAIEAAVRQLLIDVHSERPEYVSARVLNMIAFVDREWSGEIANRLRGVGRYHASRMVVLSYEPGRERLDARVMIAGDEDPRPGELALLHETIVVELGDRHLGDLLTIADPLVVTDLPTLLWSPHGHYDIVSDLMPLAQAVLMDSVVEPDAHEALDRALEMTGQAYVVDLAWLRSTPWRERVAALFDPAPMRRELDTLATVTVRHHSASTVAAALLVGWLGSRLQWQTNPLEADGEGLRGKAKGGQGEIVLRLETAPELLVPGLEGLTIEMASGRRLSLDRGPGGLHARLDGAGEPDREWTIPGASRGETGVLGEGIRQALLRDPTYVPSLQAARALLA
jgi:glucose-6-phosphate dehydrogenase assembly protein OpcA